jgi:hypothetical protein
MQSGRACEGYKRGPVFLNRTAQGWEKRSRLEEALPRRGELEIAKTDGLVTYKSQSLSPLLQISPSKSMKAQFHALFLETYLPSSPKLGPSLTQAWLGEAVRLNNPGKALEYSLHALCITRVGRNGGNQALVVKGSAAYGQALKELQDALASPKLAGTDGTLAACLVLSIYEVKQNIPSSQKWYWLDVSFSNQRPIQHKATKIISVVLNASLHGEVQGNTIPH